MRGRPKRAVRDRGVQTETFEIRPDVAPWWVPEHERTQQHHKPEQAPASSRLRASALCPAWHGTSLFCKLLGSFPRCHHNTVTRGRLVVDFVTRPI